MPLSHYELAKIAQAAYKGAWSDIAGGDVKCDLLPRGNELVIAVPGTDVHNALDLLRDADTWPMAVPGLGMMHAGFGEGGEALWEKINPLFGRQWALVTYVGHSLGGAIAENLAAWHALMRSKQQFRVVTFGCPRLAWLNPTFPALLKLGTEQVEYRNAGDPVLVEPPLWLGFHHGARGIKMGAAISGVDSLANHAMALYVSRLGGYLDY